jgi:hypothetical protein
MKKTTLNSKAVVSKTDGNSGDKSILAAYKKGQEPDNFRGQFINPLRAILCRRVLAKKEAGKNRDAVHSH